MKKRILSVVIVVIMTFGLMSTMAFAETATSGTHGDNLTWNFDNSTGTLTISGTGEMKSSASYPWVAYRNIIKSVVINEGVTTIGNSAFAYYSSLESVTIPNSVTKIGYLAFIKTAIKTISFSKNIKEVGYAAFSSIENLSEVYIPVSVEKWGRNVFDFSGIAKVEFENGITEIVDGMFHNCKSLKSVKLPSTLKTIGKEAFYHCISLESIKIPDSVTKIKKYAFLSCENLTDVALPKNLDYIHTSSFFDTPLYSQMNSENNIFVQNKIYKYPGFASGGLGRDYTDFTNTDFTIIPDGVTYIADGAIEVPGYVVDNSRYYTFNYYIPKSVKNICRLSENEENAPPPTEEPPVEPNWDLEPEDFGFHVPTYVNIFYAGTEEEWNLVNKRMDDDRYNIFVYENNKFVQIKGDNPFGNSIAGATWRYSAPRGGKLTVGAKGNLTYANWPHHIKSVVMRNELTINNEYIYILESIGAGAFENCLLLKNVTILSKELKSIEKNAFKNCPEIKNVFYNGTVEEFKSIKIKKEGNESFLGATIYCSDGTINYKKNGLKLFDDVKNSWYAEYVDYVAAAEIFVGTGDRQFSPEKTMTRAEFVQVLANVDGINTKNKNANSNFTDVKSGQWFAPAVEWASENKIVQGMGDGTFAPNQAITREQMCVMLVNYARYKKISFKRLESIERFKDDNKIATWAKKSVYACQIANIINGKGGNIFDPKGVAKRSEASAVFTVFFKDYCDKILSTWPSVSLEIPVIYMEIGSVE